MPKYRVLIEVIKPAFKWVEIEADHPLETIAVAIDATAEMDLEDFVDEMDLDTMSGGQGHCTFSHPTVLMILDDQSVIHYTRTNEVDAVNRIDNQLSPEDDEDE